MQHGMLLLLCQGTPWAYTRLAETPFSQCFSPGRPQLGLVLWLLPSRVLDFAFALAEFHTIPVEAASEVPLDTSPAVQCMGCSSCLNVAANLIKKAWCHLLWVIHCQGQSPVWLFPTSTECVTLQSLTSEPDYPASFFTLLTVHSSSLQHPNWDHRIL